MKFTFLAAASQLISFASMAAGAPISQGSDFLLGPASNETINPSELKGVYVSADILEKFAGELKTDPIQLASILQLDGLTLPEGTDLEYEHKRSLDSVETEKRSFSYINLRKGWDGKTYIHFPWTPMWKRSVDDDAVEAEKRDFSYINLRKGWDGKTYIHFPWTPMWKRSSESAKGGVAAEKRSFSYIDLRQGWDGKTYIHFPWTPMW